MVKRKRRVMSLVMTAAMATTLFAGMSVASFAASAEFTPTTITNLSEITNMAGNYKLGADVTIDASSWTPIGTSSAPFTGTFDGNGKTITWTGSAAGSSRWGVFGSSSGVIANVRTAGSLNLTGSGSYVSPLVGYSSGSVYNCQNSAKFTANNMDNAGGVVGALENKSAVSNPVMIQYCGNTGDITALKRVGGVTGAVYCNVKGNGVVDQSYSKNCIIYTKNSGSKVWSGGLVGYCKGDISNSYTDKIKLQASGGHYLSGLVGILNGANPSASATNCYANVTDFTGCAAGYDRPFVGSVDSSSAVVLTNCYWAQNNSSYTQTSGNGWGTWIGGGKIADWSALSIGDEFTTGSSSSHPTLVWETSGGFSYDISKGTAGGTEASSESFYVSQAASSEGVGTQASPFKILGAAVSVANASAASNKTIYVDGTYEFTPSESAYSIFGSVSDSGTPAVTITSTSSDLSGSFITVDPGATVNFGGLTIDGTGFANTINNSGSLSIKNQAVISGGKTAVNVNAGGSLTLNRSTVSGSSYSVKLAEASDSLAAATCTMSVNTSSGQELDINGTFYLGTGTYITTTCSPRLMLSNALSIKLQTPSGYPTLVKGSSYTLKQNDLVKVTSLDGMTDWDEDGNEIYLFVA